MLATYLIFAVFVIILLLATIIYLYPGSRKVTTVPGLDPSNPEDGNLADMGKAGSLHEFLQDLHERFGDIASFWMGQKLVISIASPDLFKQHNHPFDRPDVLYRLFEPLLTMDSIQYANGADGRKRRKVYDQCYSHASIRDYYKIFQKNGDMLVKKWVETPKDQHIPLRETMFAMSIKGIAESSFGDIFKNEKEVLHLKNNYDVCWSEMERRLGGEIPPENSPRQKHFDKGHDDMKQLLKRAIKERSNSKVQEGHELLLDLIMKGSNSENQMLADSITFLVGGTHTTGLWLTWAIYYLARHPEVEKKLYKEIVNELDQENVNHENINALKYLRQVLDETLRCSVLAPFAARVEETDTMLGGHKIPAKTPVVHALGVVLQDSEIWPKPDEFDPNRFSPEKAKERSPYAFKPFGFAGKRVCPGYQFSYAEASVILTILIRKFKIRLVEGQVVTPEYGIVTSPKDEVWVTVEKRI